MPLKRIFNRCNYVPRVLSEIKMCNSDLLYKRTRSGSIANHSFYFFHVKVLFYLYCNYSFDHGRLVTH